MKALILALLFLTSANLFAMDITTGNEKLPNPKTAEVECNYVGYRETEGVSQNPLILSLLINMPLSEHWGINLNAMGLEEIGALLDIGPFYQNKLGDNFIYRFNIGGGGFTGKFTAYYLTAGMLAVKKMDNLKYLLLEARVKSNLDRTWYTAKFHWQLISAIGLGVRAQTNSLIGPYLQIGSDFYWTMWIGYGVKQDEIKKDCVGLGLKVTF